MSAILHADFSMKLCMQNFKYFNKIMNTSMKPCPFCGHRVELDDPDSVYPNGTGWVWRADGVKAYCDFKSVPKDQWCYSVNCVVTSGGCGAEISGDSMDEAVARWNRRV